MAAITVSNKVAGITEGQTLTVSSQHGVLVGDKDAFGYPLSVAGVSAGATTVGVSGGLATIAGTYGTLAMHADGSYSYIAKNNISLPADGIVQDSFILSITDSHEKASQETLTVTVVRPGLVYVAGQPGQVLTGGSSPTVFDASLGNQTVLAGNADDVLIGGANDILIAGNGNDTVIAGPNDLIILGRGNDTITAGANDIIVAGHGNDTVTGGSNDTITLGDGNDIVVGGANDTIVLGHGQDKVTVGANNSIRVGKGTHTFIFTQVSPAGIGEDTIWGFSPKMDKIQFATGLLANFAAVKAHAKQVGGDTVISLDPKNSITLKGVALSSLQASNFIFVGTSAPTVAIDRIDGNNVINFAEAHAAGGVALSGSVSGLAANSTFQVKLADGAFSKSYTATVNAQGTGWTATIPSGDATTLADGTATVTAQVTDQYGNVSTPAVQTVAVHETPPMLSSIADQTLQATSSNGAVATFAATATDLVDGSDPVVFKEGSNVVHSGDIFGLGVHTITASAVDSAGNAASESFSITVKDTIPPVLTAVASQTDEATGPNGATATFAATATDLVDGSDPVVFKKCRRQQKEQGQTIKQKIRSALTYPKQPRI
jgi:VCBS repeat-containing protein